MKMVFGKNKLQEMWNQLKFINSFYGHSAYPKEKSTQSGKTKSENQKS